MFSAYEVIQEYNYMKGSGRFSTKGKTFGREFCDL